MQVKMKDFLINSEETGRFVVTSMKSGKKYFVEAIGNPHIMWGSIVPGSNKMSVKKGWCKNRGSIDEKDSLITKDNGFKMIHNISAGVSPLAYIEELDKKYLNAS